MGPINSYLAGEVLPTTQCFVAREDFGSLKKKVFEAFPGKAEIQRRSGIRKL